MSIKFDVSTELELSLIKAEYNNFFCAEKVADLWRVGFGWVAVPQGYFKLLSVLN